MTPLLVIIGIVLGLAAALVLLFVEIGSERLIDRLFGRLGIRSGDGPLDAAAAADGAGVVVTLHNRGTQAVRLAAIEGRDGRGARCFPRPALNGAKAASTKDAFKQLARVALAPDASAIVRLDAAELAEMDCRTLGVLDDRGRSWPVFGFEGGALTRCDAPSLPSFNAESSECAAAKSACDE
jgi:hypothetical protein